MLVVKVDHVDKLGSYGTIVVRVDLPPTCCVCVCVYGFHSPPPVGMCRGGVQCHNTNFWNTVATEVHGTYAGGVVTRCGL